MKPDAVLATNTSSIRLEELRDAWFNAPTQADQKKIAEEMQKRAFETVPYVPTAQFIIPTAFRRNLSGVIVSPVTFLWNVEKK
jgi:peptide/nickel transport system substrate-binding protein